jgi:hypothetical protein
MSYKQIKTYAANSPHPKGLTPIDAAANMPERIEEYFVFFK